VLIMHLLDSYVHRMILLTTEYQVSKDQQTWRKEFNKDAAESSTPAPTPKAKPPVEKVKLTGLPIFEYQDRGHKWVIENQTTESAKKESENGIITVDVSDPKQQVYMYNCTGVTVKVNGEKFKSLILDKCEKCNVVFKSVISSTEVVNCKRLQFQTDGVCPVFTIDKTVGCLVWLSQESAAISSFVTSMSSEVNVSFPDGEDMKELPIPEQFVHKLLNGAVASDVSDLYH
jgi:adenylyl cyclase-associated protein